MALAPPPAGAQPTTFHLFWAGVSRMLAALLGDKAHADLIITVRGGKVEMVRVNRSFLPTDLPR